MTTVTEDDLWIFLQDKINLLWKNRTRHIGRVQKTCVAMYRDFDNIS